MVDKKKRFSGPKFNIKNILMVISGILGIGILGLFIPFSIMYEEVAIIPFKTEIKKTDERELNEEHIVTVGVNGSKKVQKQASQNLFGWIFKKSYIDTREISSKIVKKPIAKVVEKGTKKYQYMICTDGSYRYYTDEQFKDPGIGFTSKSNDYCKENGQGQRARLADSPSGSGAISSPRQPVTTTKNGCTYTTIPYKTVYKEVTWLNKGQTQVTPGKDGTKSSCGWTTDPSDEIILVGTSESNPGPASSPTNSQPDLTAWNRCMAEYSSAMSKIRAAEAQGVAGLTDQKRKAEAELTRCQRAASH